MPFNDPETEDLFTFETESAPKPAKPRKLEGVSDRFGAPREYGGHTGTDLGWGRGEGVGLPKPGRVRFAGQKGGYGNRVEVEHDDGDVTTYSHLDAIDVKEGDDLDEGSLLGRVGNTGKSRGAHLHYEVLKGGKKVNPEQTGVVPVRGAKAVAHRSLFQFETEPEDLFDIETEPAASEPGYGDGRPSAIQQTTSSQPQTPGAERGESEALTPGSPRPRTPLQPTINSFAAFERTGTVVPELEERDPTAFVRPAQPPSIDEPLVETYKRAVAEARSQPARPKIGVASGRVVDDEDVDLTEPAQPASPAPPGGGAPGRSRFEGGVFRVPVRPEDTPQTVARRFAELVASDARLSPEMRERFLAQIPDSAGLKADGGASIESVLAGAKAHGSVDLRFDPETNPNLVRGVQQFQEAEEERARAQIEAEFRQQAEEYFPYTPQTGDQPEMGREEYVRGFAASKVEDVLRKNGSALAELDRRSRVSKMGWLPYLAQAPKSAALGLTGSVSSASKQVAVVSKYLDWFGEYEGRATEDLATYQFGKRLDEWSRWALGSNPDLEKEFLVGEGGQAVGSMASFILGGWATKSPKVAATVLGGLQGGSQVYEEARAMGATEEEAQRASLIGMGVLGPLEIVPVSRILGRLNAGPQGEAWRQVFRRAVADFAIEAGEEMVQEGTSEAATGLLSGKGRSFAEVLRASALGGIAGGSTSAAVSGANMLAEALGRRVEAAGEGGGQAEGGTPNAEIQNQDIEVPQSAPPVPEAPETIAAQLEAMRAGRRPVVHVTPGEQAVVPKGMRSFQDFDGGRIIYNPRLVTREEVVRKMDDGTLGELLGHVEPGSHGEAGVVVARDPQTGAEIQSSRVSTPEGREAQAESFAEQHPGAEIVAGGDELAAEVLAQREEANRAGESVQIAPEAPAAEVEASATAPAVAESGVRPRGGAVNNAPLPEEDTPATEVAPVAGEEEASPVKRPKLDAARYERALSQNPDYIGLDEEDISTPEGAFSIIEEEQRASVAELARAEAQLAGKLPKRDREKLEKTAAQMRQNIAENAEHAEEMFGEEAAAHIRAMAAPPAGNTSVTNTPDVRPRREYVPPPDTERGEVAGLASKLRERLSKNAAPPAQIKTENSFKQNGDSAQAETAVPVERRETPPAEVKVGDTYRDESGRVLEVREVSSTYIHLGERGGEGRATAGMPLKIFAERFERTKHKFSSTQVDLPEAEAARVRELGSRVVPDAALYTDPADDSYGREEHPHITVKYGLHTEQAEDVRRVLASEPPVRVRLGKTSIFPAKNGTPYDVVKVDVESEDLHRLNAKIADALKVTDTHPDYQPHVTLAYVKAGDGQNYVGKDALEGQELTFDAVTFSSSNGETVSIPLQGEKSEAGTKPADVAPAPAGFGKTLTRSYRAGMNQAEIKFASDKQRDLYDYAANIAPARNSGRNPKPQSAGFADIERRVRNLGMSEAELLKAAFDVRDDVRAQMKGVKDGETRAVADNVLNRTTAASVEDAPGGTGDTPQARPSSIEPPAAEQQTKEETRAGFQRTTPREGTPERDTLEAEYARVEEEHSKRKREIDSLTAEQRRNSRRPSPKWREYQQRINELEAGFRPVKAEFERLNESTKLADLEDHAEADEVFSVIAEKRKAGEKPGRDDLHPVLKERARALGVPETDAAEVARQAASDFQFANAPQSPKGLDERVRAIAATVKSSRLGQKSAEILDTLPDLTPDERQKYHAAMRDAADDAGFEHHAREARGIAEDRAARRGQKVGLLPDVKPTAQDVLAKLPKEKPQARTGLTPTQGEYLAARVRELADVLPGQQGALDGETPRGSVSIGVPGDGEFTLYTQAGADKLHKKLTGKTVEEFDEAGKKQAGGKKPTGKRTPVTYPERTTDKFYFSDTGPDGKSVGRFEEVKDASPVTIKGYEELDLFVRDVFGGEDVDDAGAYTVTEGQTGAKIGSGRTPKAAAAAAKKYLEENAHRLQAGIDSHLKKHGPSPRYQKPESAQSETEEPGGQEESGATPSRVPEELRPLAARLLEFDKEPRPENISPERWESLGTGSAVLAAYSHLNIKPKVGAGGSEVEQLRAALAEHGYTGKAALKDLREQYRSEAGTIPTHPAPQTETPAFKKWFGDSKVVDEKDRPLVVYHGTKEDFASFSGKKAGLVSGFKYAGKDNFFFTDNARVAGSYTDQNVNPAYDRPNVMPVYLSLQNPLEIDAGGGSYFTHTGDAIKRARKEGHDGLIVRNVLDHASAKDAQEVGPITTFIAFRPEQIKSATGNGGAFDPSSANILYAIPQNREEYELLKAEVVTKAKRVWKEIGRPGVFNTGMTYQAKQVAELMPDLARLGAYHLREIARTVKDATEERVRELFVSAMVDDLGEGIRPHLRRVYLEAKKLVDKSDEQRTADAGRVSRRDGAVGSADSVQPVLDAGAGREDQTAPDDGEDDGARDIAVAGDVRGDRPEQGRGGAQRERSFPQTLEAAGLEGGDDRTYEVYSNKQAFEDADEIIAEKGLDGAAEFLRSADDWGAEHTALAFRLLSQLDGQKAVDVAATAARALTRQGQAIQAAQIVSRLSPERVAVVASKVAAEAGTTVKPEQLDRLKKLAARALEEEERADSLAKKLANAQATIRRLRDEKPPKKRETPGVKARRMTTGLVARLEKMEAAARARMAERKGLMAVPEGRERERGSSIIPDDIADLIVIGAAKMARGTLKRSLWFNDMLAEFGERVRDSLPVIRRQAARLYREEKRKLRREALAHTVTGGRAEDFTDAEIDELIEARARRIREKARAEREVAEDAGEVKAAPSGRRRAPAPKEGPRIDALAREVLAVTAGADEITRAGAQLIARKGELSPEQYFEQLKAMFGVSERHVAQTFRRAFEAVRQARQNLKDRAAERAVTGGDPAALPREEVQRLVAERKAAQEAAADARRQLAQAFEALDPPDPLDRALGILADVWNLPRSLKSTLDLSALGRQGYLGALSDFEAGKGAARATFHALPTGRFGFKGLTLDGFEKVVETIRSDKHHRLGKKSGLYLATREHGQGDTITSLRRIARREEAFASSLPGKLAAKPLREMHPVAAVIAVPFKPLAKGMVASEHAYVATLDTLRMAMFSHLADEILANKDLNEGQQRKALEYVAKRVNHLTGRGTLGKSDTFGGIAVFVNGVFFAPRFMLSRFQTLSPLQSARAPKGARLITGKKVGRVLALHGLALAALALVGFDVEWDDPEDPDWMKARMGDHVYDFAAGLQQPARAILRSSARGVRAARGKQKSGDSTALDIWGDYLRRKEHPSTAYLHGAITGKTLEYDEVTGKRKDFEALGHVWDEKGRLNPGGGIVDLAAPLFFKEAWEAYQKHGASGVAAVAPAFFGVGYATYPKRERAEMSAPSRAMFDEVEKTPYRAGSKYKIAGRERELSAEERSKFERDVRELTDRKLTELSGKPSWRDRYETASPEQRRKMLDEVQSDAARDVLGKFKREWLKRNAAAVEAEREADRKAGAARREELNRRRADRAKLPDGAAARALERMTGRGDDSQKR